VLLCLVLASGAAGPADASWWDDLWQRPDQQAVRALQGGEPERAASLLADAQDSQWRQWRGVANYRSDQFEDAERAFVTDPSATGHYNRGNALARQGEIDRAIQAYDQALTLRPEHEDAAFNKALLERQQQQQQQSDGGSQSNPQESDSQDNAAADRSGAPQNSDPSAADEPQPQDEDGERSKSDGADDGARQLAEQDARNAEERDELDDAMEQWLRRVPDDPGGLLRRKFRHETNQRLRRGEYQSRHDERIW
jgi:Ca-activated chloride channel family protein